MGVNYIPKDYVKVIKPLLEDGTLTLGGGAKHAHVLRGDGRKYIIPSSPGDHRSFQNFKAELRRFVAGQPVR